MGNIVAEYFNKIENVYEATPRNITESCRLQLLTFYFIEII
jgi:hypothetical protein